MQAAIGYMRVSTSEQGRSGLGLAAQRRDIEAFGAREGFAVKSWHQDVQTGAGTDPLQMRPGDPSQVAAHAVELVPLPHYTRANLEACHRAPGGVSLSGARGRGRLLIQRKTSTPG